MPRCSVMMLLVSRPAQNRIKLMLAQPINASSHLKLFLQLYMVDERMQTGFTVLEISQKNHNGKHQTI